MANPNDKDVFSDDEGFPDLSQLHLEPTNTAQLPVNIVQPSSQWRNVHHTSLTTGCEALDERLNGGIPKFGLTEFSGHAGNGKSQLCMQLCLTVQLPENLGGCNKGAIYINTENSFPSNRLSELSQHFKIRYKDNLPEDSMENIILKHITNKEQLIECLTNELSYVLEGRPIGLLILDSIAAVFRSEYKHQNERTKEIRFIGEKLQEIALRYKIALIVVNQVTGSIAERQDVPSLGIAWKNSVTTRIQLIRKDDQRLLSVQFSPYIPERTIPFVIEPTGVRYKD